MSTEKKTAALGALLIACTRLDTNVRGGKQKVQKILGKRIFYQYGKKWFYNTKALLEMSASNLQKLTEQIKSA
jgi:hypothetical protein